MLQPVMPLIEYSINKDFIIANLCENKELPELGCKGKCYLAKKIKQSQNKDPLNPTIPPIDLSKYPVTLISFFDLDLFNNSLTIKKNYSFEQITHPIKYSSSLFRPPIVSL